MQHCILNFISVYSRYSDIRARGSAHQCNRETQRSAPFEQGFGRLEQHKTAFRGLEMARNWRRSARKYSEGGHHTVQVLLMSHFRTMKELGVASGDALDRHAWKRKIVWGGYMLTQTFLGIPLGSSQDE